MMATAQVEALLKASKAVKQQAKKHSGEQMQALFWASEYLREQANKLDPTHWDAAWELD